jgi:hypothetical protein
MLKGGGSERPGRVTVATVLLLDRKINFMRRQYRRVIFLEEK